MTAADIGRTNVRQGRFGRSAGAWENRSVRERRGRKNGASPNPEPWRPTREPLELPFRDIPQAEPMDPPQLKSLAPATQVGSSRLRTKAQGPFPCAKRALRLEFWTEFGPVGMARRNGSRYGTLGPPRPRQRRDSWSGCGLLHSGNHERVEIDQGGARVFQRIRTRRRDLVLLPLRVEGQQRVRRLALVPLAEGARGLVRREIGRSGDRALRVVLRRLLRLPTGGVQRPPARRQALPQDAELVLLVDLAPVSLGRFLGSSVSLGRFLGSSWVVLVRPGSLVVGRRTPSSSDVGCRPAIVVVVGHVPAWALMGRRSLVVVRSRLGSTVVACHRRLSFVRHRPRRSSCVKGRRSSVVRRSSSYAGRMPSSVVRRRRSVVGVVAVCPRRSPIVVVGRQSAVGRLSLFVIDGWSANISRRSRDGKLHVATWGNKVVIEDAAKSAQGAPGQCCICDRQYRMSIAWVTN